MIFVRQPRLGAVKRRLAAGIGAVAALRFYRHAVARLLRRVGRDRRWRCWLAITPDRAASGYCGWEAAPCRVPQGRGDLGRRMARPFATLPPGPVVVIGSDIPAIAAHHIADAFARLGSSDFVLGPASDGGYWLFGSRCRPLPPGTFSGARWSTSHALADTLTSLPRRARIALGPVLDDVDDAATFRRWHKQA